MPRFRAHKPLRYSGPLRPLKVRVSTRPKRGAAAAQNTFEEVRGVHVYRYPDHTLVSDGVYTTVRYATRLKEAGGTWTGEAWKLPAGVDVRAILDPHGAVAAAVWAKNRPYWTCCAKAQVLNHKTKHYSCPEHTVYWEDCTDEFGNPIKILYACSTCGGSPYTGT
jgi:hypothetical protein